MREIKYPLELFFWNVHDGQGNVEIQVRDANRSTVFYMRIQGREYHEAKRFTEEIAPLVVRLLNKNAIKQMDAEEKLMIVAGQNPDWHDHNRKENEAIKQRRGRK